MAANANPIVKIAGIIALVVGIIFVGAGATTWGMVTSQLSAENITVPKDADMLAGKKVGGPFTAYAQAQIINKHALAGANGLTYAELGAKAREAEEAGDTAAAEQFTEQRVTAMNGSFLRASLFTSVLAYGVSALVIGLGLLQILSGLAFLKLAKRDEVYVRDEAVARGV
ncbi:hypothetical protein [Bowdeniella massiliensis]|uniref:hypothetical protein n=1 Tax=Bowdeniella massiliensis TaxID=2932264 RepID=UPI0020292876|nr:hypothetical protein [Bowdeniella massiliensis]